MTLSLYFDLLLERIQKLTSQKVFALLVLFFLIILFINGVATVPPDQYQRLSENPFITRTDIGRDNYWQETVLLPVLAYYTNLNSWFAFNTLCFFLIVAGYMLFTFLTLKKKGAVLALLSTTTLITNPLNTIMLTWLGTPEFNFLLTIPFIFTSSSIVVFVLSLLGTMNHPIIAIAATEILVLRWLARDNIKVSHLITVVLGGTTGYFLVQAFLEINQIQVYSRFDYILAKDWMFWIKQNFTNLPMNLFSLFNIQWLVIVVCLAMFFKMDKIYFASLLTLLVLNYSITFFTVDTTRVFSLLSWGVLITCIFHSHKLAAQNHQQSLYQKQFLQALIVIFILSFLSPRYFSWKGHIYKSPFYELFGYFK